MSGDEKLKRVQVIKSVLSGGMTSEEAAANLGVTERQLRRLKSKYEKEGEDGLLHGNRGRKPKHSLPDELKAEVRRLRDEKYYDANFCHLADLLAEHENIKLSPSSVRRILKPDECENKPTAGGITGTTKRRRKVKKEGGEIDAGNVASEGRTGDLYGVTVFKREEAINGTQTRGGEADISRAAKGVKGKMTPGSSYPYRLWVIGGLDLAADDGDAGIPARVYSIFNAIAEVMKAETEASRSIGLPLEAGAGLRGAPDETPALEEGPPVRR